MKHFAKTKRLIALNLAVILLLAAMMPMGALADETPTWGEVTVSVNDPDLGGVWLSGEQFVEAGEQVWLGAWTRSVAADFVGWEVVSGGVTIIDTYSSPFAFEAYFIMPTPAVDVEVQAVFERDPNVGEVTFFVNRPGSDIDSQRNTERASSGNVPISVSDLSWWWQELEWMEFVRWEVMSGGVTIADPTSPETYFIMPTPAVDVQIRAVMRAKELRELDFPVRISEMNRTVFVDVAGEYTFRVKDSSDWGLWDEDLMAFRILNAQGNEVVPIEIENNARFTRDARFHLQTGQYTFTVRYPNSFDISPAPYASLRLWLWDDATTPPTNNPWGVVVGGGRLADDADEDIWVGWGSASNVRPVPGETVQLNATPQRGFEFVRWNVTSGDVTLNNPTAPNATFPMPNSDVFLEPIFRVRDDAGRVIVNVNNPAFGWIAYPHSDTALAALAGDRVNLEAVPSSRWEWCDEYGSINVPLTEFVRWEVLSGNVAIADPTSLETYFTMLAPAVDVKIQAVFRLLDGFDAGIVTVNVNNPDLGWAWPGQPRIELAGGIVALSASARSGNEFVRWDVISGDVTIANPTSRWAYFTMPTPAVDVEIEAVFVPIGTPPPPPRVPVTGVTIAGETTRNLTVGQTLPLAATVAPANATNPAVTWISSNPAIATVNATGQITAVAPGTATITVTTADGGHRASVTVTVTAATTPPVAVTGVTIAGEATRNLTVGQTLPFGRHCCASECNKSGCNMGIQPPSYCNGQCKRTDYRSGPRYCDNHGDNSRRRP